MSSVLDGENPKFNSKQKEAKDSKHSSNIFIGLDGSCWRHEVDAVTMIQMRI